MNNYFTKNFFRFFFGFLILIAIAFSVLIGASMINSSVDNTAQVK